MAEGAIHVAGDVGLSVHAPSKAAELTLTGRMKTRGDWDWPLESSVGFQVDLESEGIFGVVFKGDATGGTFSLAPADMSWKGTMSGPLDVGFTTSLIRSSSVAGVGIACFPHLCLKARTEVPIEHLGFEFDLGPGWLELGACDRACNR